MACVMCVVSYLVIKASNVSVERIGFSYDSVVGNGEWWRVITSSFTHFSLIHLLFNFTSMWKLRSLELVVGSMAYVRDSMMLLILSSLIHLLIIHIAIRFRLPIASRSQLCIGYSGVVFAQIAQLSMITAWTSLDFFSIPIPAILSPFFSLLITHVIVPRASFWGHLSGILAGYLAGLGAFGWIDAAILFHLFPWITVAFLFLLRARNIVPLPFIHFLPPSMVLVEQDTNGLSDVTII